MAPPPSYVVVVQGMIQEMKLSKEFYFYVFE